MTQAYDRIIATITTASDALLVTKAMVKSTEWREGTSGDWATTDCTLTAGKVYQFRTPLSGMSSISTEILPNIKASVVVEWDNTATAITTVGDYFMTYYAAGCTLLTSLGAPDTSGLTSVGINFMAYYANGCTALTSLGVPDTSGLTSVGKNFMRYYANGCTSLTSLGVPDTSAITTVGTYFMNAYAANCTALTSLGVPDTSGLTSVGTSFMFTYAIGCTALTSLNLPASTGWFATHNVNWNVPAACLGLLYGYTPNSTAQTAWQALTASGKTLYLNYIQAADHVLVSGGATGNYTLTIDVGSGQVATDYDGWDDLAAAIQDNAADLVYCKIKQNGNPVLPTSLEALFAYCESLVTVVFDGLDTSSVQSMAGTFYGCKSLASLDLSSFDTSNVTDMSYMFTNCRALTSLDLSSFDTSNVTSMSSMLTNCRALTSLDLSSFDTSNVTDMSYMCDSCSLLTTIYADNSWSVASVTDGEGMFNACTSLVGAISYNPAKTDHTYANWTTGYFTYSGEPPTGIPLNIIMYYQRMRGN